jgi:hypothetical protein
MLMRSVRKKRIDFFPITVPFEEIDQGYLEDLALRNILVPAKALCQLFQACNIIMVFGHIRLSLKKKYTIFLMQWRLPMLIHYASVSSRHLHENVPHPETVAKVHGLKFHPKVKPCMVLTLSTSEPLYKQMQHQLWATSQICRSMPRDISKEFQDTETL